MSKVHLLYYDMDNNEKIIHGVFSSEDLANEEKTKFMTAYYVIYGKYVIAELEIDKTYNLPP